MVEGTMVLFVLRLKVLCKPRVCCLFDDYRLVDSRCYRRIDNISVSSSPETQYRAGPYQIKDMIQDIGDFTHYLANLSYAYGADLSRVTFLGQSAGGYLAAIVALGYTDPWFGNLFNQTLKMESLILYYPPDDAESFFYKSHPFYHAAFKMIDGTPETNPEEYYHFTPSNLVGPDSPPCVLLHGTMDTLVYEENSLRIQQKYVKFNRPVIYIKYHFVGHAFTMNSQYHPISIYYLERFLYKVPTLIIWEGRLVNMRQKGYPKGNHTQKLSKMGIEEYAKRYHRMHPILELFIRDFFSNYLTSFQSEPKINSRRRPCLRISPKIELGILLYRKILKTRMDLSDSSKFSEEQAQSIIDKIPEQLRVDVEFELDPFISALNRTKIYVLPMKCLPSGRVTITLLRANRCHLV